MIGRVVQKSRILSFAQEKENLRNTAAQIEALKVKLGQNAAALVYESDETAASGQSIGKWIDFQDGQFNATQSSTDGDSISYWAGWKNEFRSIAVFPPAQSPELKYLKATASAADSYENSCWWCLNCLLVLQVL